MHAAALLHRIPFDRSRALELLDQLPKVSSLLRVRLSLDLQGNVSIESAPYAPPESPIRAKLALTPVCSHDPSLFIKSNRRQVYDHALAQAGTDEVLLWNERHEITEFCKGNVLFEIDGSLFTPPQKSGLLAGTHLMWMLERQLVQERVVLVSELKVCSRIFRVNGLSGQIEVLLDSGDGLKSKR